MAGTGSSRSSMHGGWLWKLQHRWQVAPDGGIKRNSVGIFGKRRSPGWGYSWPVQIWRPGPNQNRNAIRNVSLPDENFRRPDATPRPRRRFQARVYQDKRRGALTSGPQLDPLIGLPIKF